MGAPILHVTTRGAWESARVAGAYAIPPGPDGAPAPFTHLCRPDQLAGVVGRFYPHARAGDDHVALVVDPDRVTAPVVVEPADDGAGDFPHVYGDIPLDAVRDVHPLAVALRATTDVRRVDAADPRACAEAGRLLHAFNTEYDDVTPGADALAARVAEIVGPGGDAIVLLAAAEDPAVGVAVLRLRPALWTAAREAYLAELYVVPERRGEGLGRALLVAALDAARTAGADHVDLGTSEDDTAARALYESLGFDAHEGHGEGPLALFYERDL